MPSVACKVAQNTHQYSKRKRSVQDKTAGANRHIAVYINRTNLLAVKRNHLPFVILALRRQSERVIVHICFSRLDHNHFVYMKWPDLICELRKGSHSTRSLFALICWTVASNGGGSVYTACEVLGDGLLDHPGLTLLLTSYIEHTTWS